MEPLLSTELSRELTSLLREHGEQQPDQLVIVARDPELGEIKLNDYWNGVHKATFNRAKRRQYYNDWQSFYDDGHKPILGISVESTQDFIAIFSPADISLAGMGRMFVRELPNDLQQVQDIITTRAGQLIEQPLDNMFIAHVVNRIRSNT
jgi:hypothetical protein